MFTICSKILPGNFIKYPRSKAAGLFFHIMFCAPHPRSSGRGFQARCDKMQFRDGQPVFLKNTEKFLEIFYTTAKNSSSENAAVMPIKPLDEIFNKIVEYNSKGNHESIPHSDVFEKETELLIGINKYDFAQIIKYLKDAHKICSFEIIKEDKDNDISRVDGYVEADLHTIRKLKNVFQKILMDEFEKQNNRRLLVHQIVKDIYSRPNFYKNTLLGQIANKAIMLNEYENLIERNFNEYTDSWKSKKLEELSALTEKIGLESGSETAEDAASDTRPDTEHRAVDSPLYNKYSSDKAKQSLDKVLQIYGVEFFFRINLRKYNFDLLCDILEKGVINRRADLVVLKELIQKMKANIGKDSKLIEYNNKIYKLERIISRQLPYCQ
jgi:hypothetical protein